MREVEERFDKIYLDWVAEKRSDEYYVNMMIAWFFATSLVVVNQKQAEKKSENEELMKKLPPFFLMKDKPETENAELIRNIKLFSGLSEKQDKTDNIKAFIPEDTRKLMEVLGIVEDEDPKVKRIRTIHAMLSLGINFISVMLSVIVLMVNSFICYLIFSIRFIIDAIVKKIVEVLAEKVSEKKK